MKLSTLFEAYVSINRACVDALIELIDDPDNEEQRALYEDARNTANLLQDDVRERLDVPEEFAAWTCPQCGWLWTSHNVDDDGTHTMTGFLDGPDKRDDDIWLDVTEKEPR